MLPGEEHAKALGYTCYSHSGDKKSATYINSVTGVFLTITEGEAKLSAVAGLVELKLGPFSWPHPKFDLFEMMMDNATAGARFAVESMKQPKQEVS